MECHQCGAQTDKREMWDDGEENGETVYLCQMCCETEIDESFDRFLRQRGIEFFAYGDTLPYTEK